MTADYQPGPDLYAVKEDAEREGFLYGTDFFVWGIPALMSSELAIFGKDGDEYVVLYSDMGEKRERIRTPDLAAARSTFFEELARLGKDRGRGPLVGAPAREAPTPREAFEKMQREGMFPGLRWEDLERTARADDDDPS
ncbi:hypothetical protein AB6N23_17780 [Cellulomonas sp. 179-A 9B4 NHS]|uniref:hypothetical protein n=1 Tax=Cellulomonas sp. 179-A 9B4 NHS TaxID=3142379 RepID=UPI00399FBD7D